MNKILYNIGCIVLAVTILWLLWKIIFQGPEIQEIKVELTKTMLSKIKQSTEEKFENFNEIPLSYLGVNTETARQGVFDYFSNFLKIYCKVKEEDLNNKTELFILKLYNFLKNKVDNGIDFAELTENVQNGFYRGNIGDKKKYRDSIRSTFIYIIMNSNQFDDNVKKDVLASFLVLDEYLKTLKVVDSSSRIMYLFKYDKNKDVVTFDENDQGFSKALNAKQKTIPYDEFKELSYNFAVKFFGAIKVIDQDLLNYKICE